MTTRITGIVSNLDIDSLVTAGVSLYQNKLDKAKQAQQTAEWKQEQYKAVETSVTDFYTKYLDSTSSDSLLYSSNWNTQKYTSTDDTTVSATSTSSATLDNYKISVKTLAAKASTSLSLTDIATLKTAGAKYINVGGTNVDISSATTVSGAKSTVTALNTALTGKGFTATYSDFSGIVIQADAMSTSNSLAISFSDGSTDVASTKTGTLKDIAASATITNSSGNVYNYTGSSNTTTLDGVTFDFKDVTSNTSSTTSYITSASINNLLGDHITKIGTSSKTDYTFGSNGSIAIADDGTITNSGSYPITIESSDGTTKTTKTIKDDGTVTTVKTLVADDTLVSTSTKNITSSSITSLFGDDITKIGTSNSTEYTLNDNTTYPSKITIADDGTTTVSKYDATLNSGAGGYSTLSGTNTIKLTSSDGSTKTINADGTVTTSTTDSNPVTLTGTNDVTDLQTKITSFVNDYSTLIKTINGKIYETYNKDYPPLTDTQKTSMSETEITKWETKAQVGLLKNDSYMEKLASDMKETMTTLMKSTGLNLEKIGITPVGDYTTKNGTFTVDSTKLKSALEGTLTNNKGTLSLDDVKSLFLDGNNSVTSFSTTVDAKSGILAKLKVALNNNVCSSTSEFSKKAGNEEYATTAYTNELYLYLQDQSTLIDDLDTKLTDREDALYAKYSTMETNLNKLSSSSSLFSSSS
jgi:flagellar hook-associated protein 2